MHACMHACHVCMHACVQCMCVYMCVCSDCMHLHSFARIRALMYVYLIAIAHFSGPWLWGIGCE